MKTFEPGSIRNVGIVAHSGAGKTTLAEAILFDAGATSRRGTVQEGNTVMDFDPEEIKREISISTSVASCEWEGSKINILDTPGDQNFVADTLLCMSVIDTALVIVSAVSGIKTQTEKVWGWARERSLSKIIFINKMDNERAAFETVYKQIEDTFREKTLKFTIPIGSGDSFKGVVDLLYMKAYIYEKDGGGKFDEQPIPDDMKEVADKERQELLESIAELDESLLEKYVADGDLADEDFVPGLRKAVIAGAVVPVICGSATLNIVVRKTLNSIMKFCPSPLDVGPRKGKTADGKDAKLAPDPKGEAVAQIFKTVADPYAGKLSIFRVFSGSIKSDNNLTNTTRGEKEHLGSLLSLQGKKQTPVGQAVFGDIAAVAKLKSSITGDTISENKSGIVLDKTEPPHPVISFAVAPKSKGDEEKLSSSLARFMEEDPTLHARRDMQTNELIVSGMGQIHIEVAISKLKDKFGLEVDLRPPRIAYKETITGKSKGHGRLKKQSGGHGQFADCWLEVEPTTDGREFEFVNAIVGGVIPRQYIPGVEKGVKEAMQGGVLAGYPVTHCKVTLYDGKFHDVDSSELAFKIAAAQAFREAFMAARPALLEPVMELEVAAPEENVGDIMSDLNRRRGRVAGVDAMAGEQRIKATVPMAEILSYAPDLRSITGGRGQFTMQFASYDEAPTHIAQKVIDGSKKADSEPK
ncbi:Translation elongation factor G [hydrothermal vent metagenome]|uniref:Translation elongation factor G n=1 Tax=hydrothermal vent metagenome TaxID=652676 RepID=A0A3B1CH62_9ZZZZ